MITGLRDQHTGQGDQAAGYGDRVNGVRNQLGRFRSGGLVRLLPFLALAALTGCAATQSHQQGATDYCAEYPTTMAGKSAEEQRRAAEAHIVRMHGTADAAHIERHMKMMEQRCGRSAG